MYPAKTTSPFVTHEMDAPWILWAEKEPIFMLENEKQTDGRYVADEKLHAEDIKISAVPAMPQPQRYNAVLSRIDQARKKAVAFSAWSS